MKILLLEDDPPTSDYLSSTLASHHYAVDAIADGVMGLDMATHWHYDLLILDWLLPSLDGPEICRRLRARGNHTPILMLTVRDSNDDVVAGLDAGADDYVAKSCDPSQLLARVRALLRRGQSSAKTPILRWGDLTLDPAQAQVFYQDQTVPCRPKEYELLELFLRQPQRLLTRSVIIDHLWPMADTPVEGSVTNLIKDLRQRLKRAGLSDSPIETVYGLGYRLRASPGALAPPAEEPPELTTLSPRLTLALRQATQRFEGTLSQRLALMEIMTAAIAAGTLTHEAHQEALAEAHKLAGGLAMLGYRSAATVAEEMEALLYAQPGGSPPAASQIQRCLDALKLALAQPDQPLSRSAQP